MLIPLTKQSDSEPKFQPSFLTPKPILENQTTTPETPQNNNNHAFEGEEDMALD